MLESCAAFRFPHFHFYCRNYMAASPAVRTLLGIIRALFCFKQTNKRIYSFWSTCLWILGTVTAGTYILPYIGIITGSLGQILGVGNHLSCRQENAGSERWSNLLKITQPRHKVRWYKAGVPHLRDLMTDDLGWSWCNNNRNKMHSKCNALESSQNQPPTPVCEKITFHETGPWYQKVWQPLERKKSFTLKSERSGFQSLLLNNLMTLRKLFHFLNPHS